MGSQHKMQLAIISTSSGGANITFLAVLRVKFLPQYGGMSSRALKHGHNLIKSMTSCLLSGNAMAVLTRYANLPGSASYIFRFAFTLHVPGYRVRRKVRLNRKMLAGMAIYVVASSL
ncbi:predicted protein [Histoplasma capsulatum var. duboisii H88]|uniref:Predicted protein n=1 Tax=Ajellomyces capsulatus (strain H88) TaxID=544711 RepID=F0URM3_AJEC8|nr:predicted protein [Histoplasma capsulatum var. duboisii H88]